MISASIVTYKTGKEDLDRVLDSVLREKVDIVFVIDHSPDDSIKSLLPGDKRIIYRQRPNLGYGAGHNYAMAKAMEAGARYHAVLNPDIFWDGNVIESLADYMTENKNVGMMVPKILYPDGTLQYVCKLIPTPFDLIANRFLPENLVRKRLARFRLEASGYDRVMNVPYMHGCFFMLRMDTLKETGMFDERFFMYPEDIDLTRRIHENWQTLFFPSLSIYHAHAAESRKSWKMLRIHAGNMIKYFNKWGWFFDRKRRHINREVLLRLKDN